MNSRLLWLLGIFAISVLMGGGVWFWTEFIAADHSPTIRAVTLEPAMLRFVGGTLRVEAEVTDDVLVEKVSGLLRTNDAQVARVVMQGSVTGVEGNSYSASFSIPANTQSTGQPVNYTVQVLAVDNMGQESTEEVAIQVPSPVVPPAPPHLSPAD